MTAVEILEELESRNVHLEVAGDQIHCRPKAAIPADLVPVMRRQKAALIFLLYPWPPESLEAERRFGGLYSRLCPFLGKRVRSPYGEGRLFRVFSDSAGIVVRVMDKDGEHEKVLYCSPMEVLPI